LLNGWSVGKLPLAVLEEMRPYEFVFLVSGPPPNFKLFFGSVRKNVSYPVLIVPWEILGIVDVAAKIKRPGRRIATAPGSVCKEYKSDTMNMNPAVFTFVGEIYPVMLCHQIV